MTGEVLQVNDDINYPDNLNSRITFTAREPRAIMRVSSAGSATTGSYTLNVSATGT